MWEAGLSVRQVFQHVGVAVQTISDWKSRYVAEGNVTRRCGKWPTTTDNKEVYRLLSNKSIVFHPSKLYWQWKERVSRWTVRRRLRLALCPKLTQHHMERRLHWCMAKSAWRLPTWKRVVFTNESKFACFRQIEENERNESAAKAATRRHWSRRKWFLGEVQSYCEELSGTTDKMHCFRLKGQ